MYIFLCHLNFYNELMTPAINNGPNYFTYFTALILEETYHGQRPWYTTNEQLVERESRAYWWARDAGCHFLNASCFELIERRRQLRSNSFHMSAVYNEYWTSAFCDENDLLHEMELSVPKSLCFWNGTRIKRFDVHCKTMKQLQIRPMFYEPITLQSQFPALNIDQHGSIRKHAIYGSDYDHRYCPFTLEMLEGSLNEIPYNSKLIECDSIEAEIL